MLEITPAAKKQIKEYFDGKKIEPIRVFINESG